MSQFLEMLRRNRSSPYLHRAMNFVAPLKEYLGVNHFWYYRITHSGGYAYMGTHEAWNEYCFEHSLIKFFPCLRHPKLLGKGISLMRANPSDIQFKKIKKIAWDKFRINFNLNLYETFPEGIEAFGFATHFNDSKADERILNELPLLRSFLTSLKSEHRQAFRVLEENQVDLASYMGTYFYERPKEIALSLQKERFLKQIGYAFALELTRREKDILKFLASGYPASYIKTQLHLSIRTVENYIAVLRDKLNCRSKVELTQKAQQISATGLLDEP